jgi:hypothetical protein
VRDNRKKRVKSSKESAYVERSGGEKAGSCKLGNDGIRGKSG